MFQDPTVVSVVKRENNLILSVYNYGSNFIYTFTFSKYTLFPDTFSFDITQPWVTCSYKK